MKNKKVIAEQVVSYTCNCPHCDETIYSEFTDYWDTAENQHQDLEIQCPECSKFFTVQMH